VGNSEYEDRLAQGGSWKDVPDEPEKMPAGTYIFQLQDAKVVEINGILKVRWEHFALSGEEQGRVVSDLSAIEPNPEGTKQGNDFMMSLGKARLAKMCEVAGVDFPDDKRDTEEAIEQIAAAAPCYRAEVKHTKSKKNDRVYENVTVLDAVDSADAGGDTKSKAREKAAPTKKEPVEVVDESEGESEGSAEMPDIGATIAFDDGDGGTITAVVTKVKGDVVFADDQNPKVAAKDREWELDTTKEEDAFTVVESEDGDGDEDDEEDVDALIDLGEGVGLEFDEDDDCAAMAKKIADEKGPLDSTGLTDEEKAICEKYDIPIKAPDPEKKSKKKKKKKRKS
jgi:hypothetical protein